MRAAFILEKVLHSVKNCGIYIAALCKREFCVEKILVGNTQTLELHPMDAGCAMASPMITVFKNGAYQNGIFLIGSLWMLLLFISEYFIAFYRLNIEYTHEIQRNAN